MSVTQQAKTAHHFDIPPISIAYLAVAILTLIIVVPGWWLFSSYGGSETKVVTVCSKHLLADSGETRVVTSSGSYNIDNYDASRLKRGQTYQIETAGWSFSNFSLKRTITDATDTNLPDPAKCG